MKGGIYSVGGSEEPVRKCVEARKPEAILFVVSATSRAQVKEKILGNLGYTPQYDIFELRNEDSLEDTYEDIRREMPQWMRRRGLAAKDIYFNYTGGTKSMSAGLALAALELLPTYSYVSGKRDKDGLGIVITGTEKFIDGRNPWHRRARKEREQATQLLALGMADSAALVLKEAQANQPDGAETLSLLAEFCEMLAEQQRFSFSKARGIAQRITRRLALVFEYKDQRLAEWLRKQENYLACLAEQAKAEFEGSRLELLGELLLNAERCVLAKRYDDAVARLYRAVEMYGQNWLAKVIPGAQSGKLYKKAIPSETWSRLRQWNPPMKILWSGEQNEHIVLGLGETYSFLSQYAPQDCGVLKEVYEEKLKPFLTARNNSILAHGVQPLEEKQYQNLDLVLRESLHIEVNVDYRWPAIDFSLL